MRYSPSRPSLYASIAGTSTASNRRLPGSVSSSPMGPVTQVRSGRMNRERDVHRADSPLPRPASSSGTGPT